MGQKFKNLVARGPLYKQFLEIGQKLCNLKKVGRSYGIFEVPYFSLN